MKQTPLGGSAPCNAGLALRLHVFDEHLDHRERDVDGHRHADDNRAERDADLRPRLFGETERVEHGWNPPSY